MNLTASYITETELLSALKQLLTAHVTIKMYRFNRKIKKKEIHTLSSSIRNSSVDLSVLENF